jgi:integrase
MVRIPLGRDASGTRKYHNTTITGTKKDAQRHLTKTLREMDTNTFVDASPVTLATFLVQWLETAAKPRVREKTLIDYRRLATSYLIPELGHRKLSQLTANEIQAVYASLQADKGLSPRSIRYAHSVLHGALEQAVRWNMLAKNVAKLVNLPRQSRKEMQALSASEATTFLAASKGTRWDAFWVLLLTTGLRPGEALALKWSDIESGKIRVQRTLTRVGKSWSFVEPKTSRARRVVTLPKSAMESLSSHRLRQVEDRLQAGSHWANLDLIFASRKGEPLDYKMVARRHFKPLIAATNLPRIRPYDLRHTCATLLLGAGENVKVVSERLGHASASLTLDVYSHVLPDMQQQAAERLEKILFA